MKNSRQPIYPIEIKGIDFEFKALGLTKREYFAAVAMQGLLSSFTEKAANGAWGSEVKETVQVALSYADTLLEELEKPTEL
jgi:hypothetical protein